MWRNELEIQDICDALRQHRMLAPWALVLRGWVDNVNSHSDGWPYWKAGARAADRLSDLLARAAGVACSREERDAHRRGQRFEPTLAELQHALVPMKSIATRHNMPQPTDPHVVADGRVAHLQAQLELAQREAAAARVATAALAARPQSLQPVLL